MATFRPVNTTLVPESRNGQETNPLTPRPNVAPNTQLQHMNRDDATTPTRANFGTLASQRPLPASTSFPPPTPSSALESEEPSNTNLRRGNSQYSSRSRDSQDDVEMGEDGAQGHDGEDDDEEGSGDEVVNPDGTRTKKKGKSQRFYCTDYPPCNLSFTRSEHLARHIRKHTGERPFQCHCSRRFSRLDNLRQHAQTVHQNEDIPQDSLAATGTRFQRQVRTDRVRPPGSRSRGNTVGSQTGPVRGHHRNSLSTSSISSVGSAYSQASEIRRRPPPLVMAGDRARYSQEIFGRPESPTNQYQYRAQSPGGFSTPTSATFSTGQNSPRWTNEMQSPMSTHSRTASIYSGHRTPGRRLSVPSAGNPFQSPHGNNYGPPSMGQIQHPNIGSFSPSSSMIASPTPSNSGSTWSRRESMSNSNEEAWRRRTWHPDSYTNVQSAFTSRLQQVTTPNTYAVGTPPQPPVVPSNAPPLQPPMRLPGIESFDPLRKPTTPIRREPSPMLIDTPSRINGPQQSYPAERPTSQHWDQGIQRNFNQLNLVQGPPATEWASEANRALQAQAQASQPAVRFEESTYSARPHTSAGPSSYHPHHQSAPPVTPREAKRMGWYQGPVARTSPADSSSSEGGIPGTPSSSTAGGEYNPGIVHASGWVENRNGNDYSSPLRQYPTQTVEGAYTYSSQQQTPTQQQISMPKTTDSNMLRLEALVAVATSEENVAAAY